MVCASTQLVLLSVAVFATSKSVFPDRSRALWRPHHRPPLVSWDGTSYQHPHLPRCWCGECFRPICSMLTQLPEIFFSYPDWFDFVVSQPTLAALLTDTNANIPSSLRYDNSSLSSFPFSISSSF